MSCSTQKSDDGTYTQDNPNPLLNQHTAFVDSFDLIWKHRLHILDMPFLFRLRVPQSNAPLSRSDYLLPLGGLVEKWMSGELLDTCPECGGTVYIIGATGNPLSGSHQWRGLCPTCKADRFGTKQSFGEVLVPLRSIFFKYPPEPIPPYQPRFRWSWKDGAIPIDVEPDTRPPEAVGCTVSDLATYLGRIDDEEDCPDESVSVLSDLSL
jgi:hypothetical protein